MSYTNEMSHDVLAAHERIKEQALQSGLNPGEMNILTTQGEFGEIMIIRFCGVMATGTFEDIAQAIVAAESYEELEQVCRERMLLIGEPRG